MKIIPFNSIRRALLKYFKYDGYEKRSFIENNNDPFYFYYPQAANIIDT